MTATAWNEDHWITDWQVSERYPVYTRANAGEVLPDPSSPLNVTLVWNKGLNVGWRLGNVETLGTHREDELDESWPENIGNFAGYHYVCLSAIQIIGARLPGLTVDTFNRSWVGDHPDLPVYEPKDGDVDPGLTDALAAKSAWAMTTTAYPEVEETKARAEAARANRPVLAELSDEELVARARSFVPDLVFDYAHHVVTTVLAMVGPVVAGELLAGIGEQDSLGVLLSGIGDIDSAAPSFAIWRLGRAVQASPALTAAFDEGTAGLLDRLAGESDPSVREFIDGFDDFLFRWGSRAPNEWDLRSDSWETRPELALVAIDTVRAAGDGLDPAISHERNTVLREKKTAELAARMPDDESRQAFLAAAAAITRWMPWRERTKTSCVKAIGEMRAALYELGDRMVSRGIITDRHNITMVTDDELDALVADPASFRDEIARRLPAYLELFELEPPFFLTENLPLSQWPRRTARPVLPVAEGDVLHGVGVSPGTVRGIARIIVDPFETGDFAPGDILIAPQTDPAWTPLFLSAAAVVNNVGSIITHSVIVCRELGLPCVVAVADATKRIPDGAQIEVDGLAGTVRVVSLP
ncbi:MAG: rifampicin phosphotransferase [Pseudonocardiales bacterium]|nr:rifampicin phosphotransferase [Pseudonocardiales bacterium]